MLSVLSALLEYNLVLKAIFRIRSKTNCKSKLIPDSTINGSSSLMYGKFVLLITLRVR